MYLMQGSLIDLTYNCKLLFSNSIRDEFRDEKPFHLCLLFPPAPPLDQQQTRNKLEATFALKKHEAMNETVFQEV